MHVETEKKVADLRKKTDAAQTELNEITKALGDNDNEYVKGLIRQVSFWLGDVDSFFIKMLEERRTPPRTVAEESHIVENADAHLNVIVLPLIRSIRDLAVRYGPNIETIG